MTYIQQGFMEVMGWILLKPQNFFLGFLCNSFSCFITAIGMHHRLLPHWQHSQGRSPLQEPLPALQANGQSFQDGQCSCHDCTLAALTRGKVKQRQKRRSMPLSVALLVEWDFSFFFFWWLCYSVMYARIAWKAFKPYPLFGIFFSLTAFWITHPPAPTCTWDTSFNPLSTKYPDLNSPNLPWTKCLDSVGRIGS